MSWRVIASSLLALAGCSSGTLTADVAPEGEALKISYFRSNINPSARKYEPTYKVIMSDTWRDRVGQAPREPFGKAAPGAVYVGYLPDRQVKGYFQKLKDLGIDGLVASEPESYDPQALYKDAKDPHWSEYARVFTIGTDAWHKSYSFRDQQRSGDLRKVETFVKCERLVAMMVQMALHTQTEVQPVFRTDR